MKSKVTLPLLLACAMLGACSTSQDAQRASDEASPYLIVFAGDQDTLDSDFLAVIDLQNDVGEVVATTPIKVRNSQPHHMEYTLPPAGELLFMNAHHHELSLLVDVSSPTEPRIVKTFMLPSPFRFPHDYTRTPSGTRLVGFLRSE